MLGRLVTLICVAILSGIAGTAFGILIAPAPGHESRAWVAGFVEQNGDVAAEAVEHGRRLTDAITDFLSRRLASSGEA